MSKLTYIRCGDYDIPNLKISEQPETSIGKYGRMRKSYLKEHRPILYNHLLMSEKLYPHLLEIDRILIRFPLSIWNQPPAKWKSAASAPAKSGSCRKALH